MYGFISVLIMIVCALLIIIVLVQNSKGGGLAANFASSTQIMGVRRTADFLEKATWTLATALLVLLLFRPLLCQKSQKLMIPRLRARWKMLLIQMQFPIFPTAVPATR